MFRRLTEERLRGWLFERDKRCARSSSPKYDNTLIQSDSSHDAIPSAWVFRRNVFMSEHVSIVFVESFTPNGCGMTSRLGLASYGQKRSKRLSAQDVSQ